MIPAALPRRRQGRSPVAEGPHMLIAAAVILAVAGAVTLWIRANVLVVVVRGPSMRPTYDDGDRLVARRRRSAPGRGDVVVFRNPRAHGVPGSSDGPLLVKRVAAGPAGPAPEGMGTAVVPAGHVAVLGDNPAQSLDSRHLGFIPVENVIAVVVRRMDTHGRALRTSGSSEP
ncbi:S26 family signal peptidase [Actinoplanes sp. CA-252034]|uniref:S26 family signal peptidase n=1 Tax=Actinoplanes sp. CA-252034 TaxID=3239906 RepID=UPI003D99CF5B